MCRAVCRRSERDWQYVKPEKAEEHEGARDGVGDGPGLGQCQGCSWHRIGGVVDRWAAFRGSPKES